MHSEIKLDDLPSRTMICEDHGRFISTGRTLHVGHAVREMWSICPQCKAHNATQTCLANAQQAALAEQGRLAEALQQSAIPKRFAGSSFDNFDVATDKQARTLNECMAYADSFERHLDQGTGLVLAGGVGTGKSHLACAILRALMPAHVGAYTTLMDLVHLLREGWGSKAAKPQAHVLAELGRLPLLVIDEIGVQYGTVAEQVHLFEVLDRRYRDMRPTILITNQDQAGFKGFVGPRIADRLRETANWFNFDWASHRVAARLALCR